MNDKKNNKNDDDSYPPDNTPDKTESEPVHIACYGRYVMVTEIYTRYLGVLTLTRSDYEYQLDLSNLALEKVDPVE